MALLSSPAHAELAIPLSIETIGDAQRLVIHVGINGSSPQPYLFDTGSSGFNAAYYDGVYDGPGNNPFDWSFGSTDVSDANVYYSGGFGYQLNAVRVAEIQVYNPSNLTTPTLTLSADSVSPGSPGYVIGQVTQRITKVDSGGDFTNRQGEHFDYDPSFTNNMANGVAPLSSGLYGTFGASMFTGLNVSSPGGSDYVNGSVLGQSTTTGWAVVANAGGGLATAFLGLTDAMRGQFTTAVDWTATGEHPYPNSNATGGTEFGTDFDYHLSGQGNDPLSWTISTLLDSGTPGNDLGYNGPANDLDPYQGANDLLGAGYLLDISGDVSGADIYSLITTNGAAVVTDDVNLEVQGVSTVGIGFFLNNSVAFDLQNQQTLYTSGVVVPEPGLFALVFGVLAGLAALVHGRRRHRG